MDLTLPPIRIDAVRINQFLRPGPLRQIVLSCKVVFLLACAAMLGVCLYDILQNKIEASTASMRLANEIAQILEERPQESGGRRARRKMDADTMAAKNLFGDLTPKTAANKEPAPKAAPQMQLALVGTFIAEDVHESYAIIEDQKKKEQQDFLLNDTVFGEARLAAIFPDKVELDRNGTKEILKLDETGESSGEPTEAGLPVDEFVVQEAEVESALQNLPLLLTQARAVPYFKGGQSVGLRLFAIKTGSLYEKVGLKNGDILKAIDGNSLSDITQAAKLFETLKQQKNISVNVERNREERVFRYQIR